MQKNMTVKELPDQERPYEKCLAYGAGALSDAAADQRDHPHRKSGGTKHRSGKPHFKCGTDGR